MNNDSNDKIIFEVTVDSPDGAKTLRVDSSTLSSEELLILIGQNPSVPELRSLYEEKQIDEMLSHATKASDK